MKWGIIRDLVDADCSIFKGVDGYPDRNNNKRFRLLDDDGIVYFEGIAELDVCDSEDGFEPLDNFGISFGCTEIQYWESDKWETL